MFMMIISVDCRTLMSSSCSPMGDWHQSAGIYQINGCLWNSWRINLLISQSSCYQDWYYTWLMLLLYSDTDIPPVLLTNIYCFMCRFCGSKAILSGPAGGVVSISLTFTFLSYINSHSEVKGTTGNDSPLRFVLDALLECTSLNSDLPWLKLKVRLIWNSGVFLEVGKPENHD